MKSQKPTHPTTFRVVAISYLVVAKVRGRLAVNKQRSHRSHMEMFNPKKLNEVEGKDHHSILSTLLNSQ
jgi:hypothetical protein